MSRDIPSIPIIHSGAQAGGGVLDCEGCGACCLHMGFPSYVLESDSSPAEASWVTMPESLKAELVAYIDSYEKPAEGELDGACIWFDPQRRQCKHHEHRPNVCRNFQVGGKDCLAWREHYRIDI